MGKIDMIMGFATLHAKTCGGFSALELQGIQGDGEQDTLRQRCRCGEEQMISLSLDELEAVRDFADANPAVFDDALRQMSRRNVQ